MEDSLLSSDDAGFFSANDEWTEEESELSLSPVGSLVLSSPSSTAELNYDKLLARYLYLARQPLRPADSFTIVDYDEMLCVLMSSPYRSSLQVAAHLLSFAVAVWAQQVEVVKRCANSQAEEIVRQTRNRKRKHDHDEEADIQTNTCSSTTKGNGHQKISSEYDAMFFSQYSGLEPQYSPQLQRPRPSRLKANSEGKFITNEDSIIFEVNAASTDVVSRRMLLHMKFQELASDSYCDFNIHNEYGSELSFIPEANRANEMDADAEQLFRWIFNNYNRHPLGGMDKLPVFDYGVHDNEERESVPDDFESHHYNDVPSENDINMNPESENVEPSELEMENTMPVLQLQETLATINSTELSILARKDDMSMKSLRKERGPLGPLNGLENFEDMSREAKRAIDTIENFDMSFLIVDRQPDSGSHFPDIETIRSELPDLGCGYDSLQIAENDIELTMMDVDPNETDARVPSPLFDEAGTTTVIFQRPPLINIKAVIQKLEDSAIEELGTEKKEEIHFLELIKKSELNVSSKSDHSTVSVAMTFLGALHMAHSQKLYLVPTDDEMFNVTTRRPQIDLPSSFEHFEKRVKRGIQDCDDMRINHQRED